MYKFRASAAYALMCADFKEKKIAVRRRHAVVLAKRAARDRGEVGTLVEAEIQSMIDELTVEFKAAEGRRRAKETLRRKWGEVPREPTEEEVSAATATSPDYPVLVVSKKDFDAQMCKCLRQREASKCDCPLCAYINWNMSAWNRARGKWDYDARCKPNEKGEKCAACTPGSDYRLASQSADHMMAHILCPKCHPCDMLDTGFPPKPPPLGVEATVGAAPALVPPPAVDVAVGVGPATLGAASILGPALIPAPAVDVGVGVGPAALGAPSILGPVAALREREELRLDGAPKPFMVYAKACVYGIHVSTKLGRYISLTHSVNLKRQPT
jgi:hypothetical protein